MVFNKFICKDIELVENFALLYESKIVLYGAGWNGYETFRLLNNGGISVAYFCDSDSRKWGDTVCKTKIISPQELKTIDENEKITVIVTPLDYAKIEQIVNDIKTLGVKTDNIFTTQVLRIAFLKNAGHLKVDETMRALYEQKEKLSKPFFFDFWQARIFHWQLNHPFDDIPKILVYQPGKAGGSSVQKSFSAIKIPIYHSHYINLEVCSKPEIKAYLTALRNYFKKLEPLKIITLVREPLSRDYSAFFQLMTHDFYEFLLQPGKSFATSVAEFMEKCYDFRYLAMGYDEFKISPLGYFDWFEKELKAGFGIDLLALHFDKEKGYSIIKQGNIEVLAMKCEKLNSLESVIGEFVGAPNFKLINANEASEKTIYNLYKKTREIIKIPRRLVSRYYDNNPYMDHFYTKEEKREFLKKWENNIVD